ncbi:MAG TPA: YfiR family protein [Vitreimonas sp.]|nr:YfiR family protein [Vitreimonas sp.]
MPAHAQSADESAVKAAFLTRFGSFTEWPPTAFSAPDTRFSICVAGSSSMLRSIDRFARGSQIGGRAVVVRRVADASDISGCQILYLAASRVAVADFLRAARGRPVLTVTDERYGARRGVIHFVVVDDRVRFHIDRDAAEQNRLGLSSRLLSIALSVRGHGGASAP